MHDTLWQSALGEIELTVSSGNFKTWFEDTEIMTSDDDEVVIAVKNIFAKKQFEARFDSLIADVLKKNGISARRIRYEVKTQGKTTKVSRETTPATKSRVDELMGQAETRSKSGRRKKATLDDNNLNPRYTFDNFIVGSSNDLAYTASRAVATNPGTKYNPIYFYGGVGLGKTHLMQAVGNEILQKHPELQVLYVSSETFVNEFLDHIRFKKKGFANKYRNVDVLIIDDMQFIAGKEKTQEEFFHTFNHLHQNNKQIIISSDKPPRSIPTLTERLRSRFEMGMAIDIQTPDFETRSAIIAAKSDALGVEFDSETIEYIAENVKSNVRELEGTLNKIVAHAELRGMTIDAGLAAALIEDTRNSRPRHITPRNIVDRTARHFGIKIDEICGARRDKHIVVPRQVAMYLLRSELHLSFPKVARELGRKDHTTAIHSVEKVTKLIKLDQDIREHVNLIQEALYD